MSREENSHRHPRFLPDGRDFIYFTRVGAMGTAVEGSGIWIASLDGGEPRRLTHASAQAEYTSGHLLFARGDALLAQPFDADRRDLTGILKPWWKVWWRCREQPSLPSRSSQQGLLAYQVGWRRMMTELAWFNRDGARTSALGEPAYQVAEISPDQTRAAVTVADSQTGAGDIWMYDPKRGSQPIHLRPFGGRWNWAPDGQQIYWASTRVADYDIFTKNVDGAGFRQGGSGERSGADPIEHLSRWALPWSTGGWHGSWPVQFGSSDPRSGGWW